MTGRRQIGGPLIGSDGRARGKRRKTSLFYALVKVIGLSRRPQTKQRQLLVIGVPRWAHPTGRGRATGRRSAPAAVRLSAPVQQEVLAAGAEILRHHRRAVLRTPAL